MNKRGALGFLKSAGSLLRGFQNGLGGRQFSATRGELRGQGGELRVQMETQCLKIVLYAIARRNLFGLACTNSLQVRQDHVAKQAGHFTEEFIHL